LADYTWRKYPCFPQRRQLSTNGMKISYELPSKPEVLQERNRHMLMQFFLWRVTVLDIVILGVILHEHLARPMCLVWHQRHSAVRTFVVTELLYPRYQQVIVVPTSSYRYRQYQSSSPYVIGNYCRRKHEVRFPPRPMREQANIAATWDGTFHNHLFNFLLNENYLLAVLLFLSWQ
jgi:hypothetical protein